MLKTLLSIGFPVILPVALTAPIFAQSITAAPDGTGTIIAIDGNTYHIQGGTQAGHNLFHSFEQFGLSTDEIANFLSNPSITNIFGRVTGGNASIIDGLIQANPNLYLMNPAGIVFGANASLNVGGDFFATTADQIGFAAGWFNATGLNDYATLMGAPNQFSFLSGQPGAIFNAGELASAQGITLIGGTVANTGVITASEVTLAAVPGTRLVNLAQDGMLLSLDLPQAVVAAGITPLDLPGLLTAGGIETAESLVTGNVQLEGTLSGAQVDLLAANQVTVTAPGVVVGDARVVRFSADGDNPDQAVFIDRRADNPEALLYGAEAGTVSQIIERDENGIEVISEQLAVISDSVGELDSVAIVAEGNEGNFWLGNQWIRSENIADYATQLQSWGAALTESADLLLYSCFTALGATGEALVNSIANLTGADVAASVDATGSANYGGDWDLEYSTLSGTIEAGNPFTTGTLSTWDGKLATYTVGAATQAALEAAINLANGSGTRDTIYFGTGITSITLTSALPTITEDLTISGGSTRVTIERDTTAGAFRIFTILTDSVTIQNLTIQNGSAFNGGGIFAQDNLAVINSTISGNSSGGFGGGIHSISGTVIIDSIISGNSAALSGGGLYESSSLDVRNSTISGNSSGGVGGGIYMPSSYGAMILNDGSTVSGNFANLNGGGISTLGEVTLDNATVSGNTALNAGGGGIASRGDVTLTNNANVLGNSAALEGGGIASLGNVELTNGSTVADNLSNGLGGGIASLGNVTLDNATVSDNSSSNNGGGISGITVTLTNGSTVSGNSTNSSGGGIFSDSTVTNGSTVSGNSSHSNGGGVFSANAVTLTNGATVSGNSTTFFGSGIYSGGDVNLTAGATVSGNSTNSSGGGILSRGNTLINDSTVSGNTAGGVGGGIISDSTVILTNGAMVSGNSANSGGGGIFSDSTVIDGSTVSGNTANGNGGGVFSYSTVTLDNATVSENSTNRSGGGIYSGGDVNLTAGATVSGNSANSDGGGIYSGGDVNLTAGATVSGNTTNSNGGGIYGGGDVNLTAGATVSGNTANSSGGGIHTGSGNINGTNSRIVGNAAPTGGGIYSQSGIISLTDHQGDLDLDLFARNAVALSGSDAITLTGDVQTGGQVFGAAATGNLTVTGLDTFTTAGGALTLNSTGGTIRAGALNTAGGALTLTSTGGEIHAGALDTRTNAGNGGAIAATATGDIAVATLTTQATNGTGGAVTLTSNRHIRVSGSLGGFSINTAGTTSGGDITLTHGGNGRTLFSIGNASINGTAGAITTGSQTLAPTDPTHEFLGNYTKQPGIQILTNAPIAAIDTTLATVLNPPQPVTALDITLLNTTNENVLTTSAGSGLGLSDANIQAGSLDDPAILAAAVKLDSLMGDDFSDSLAEDWLGSSSPESPTSPTSLAGMAGLGNLSNSAADNGEVDEDVAEDDDDDDNGDDAQSIANIRETFKRIQEQTGTSPAFVYAIGQPDALELIIITPDNQLLRTVVPEADRHTLRNTIRAFRRRITGISPGYLDPAEQLYDWLIRPLESTLENLNIDTLVFAMGEGLRTIPMAALHDGEQFLIEKYSLGQIPSLSLTNSDYQPLHDAPVVAMGASQFRSLNPLPAVPAELASIAATPNLGQQYLNEQFTFKTLQAQSQNYSGILHLATHASFQAGSLEHTYIQLWDQKVSVEDLRALGWYEKSQIELLVLSACETAIDSPEAELGFAGLAVQTGAKSALASLWQVSDLGTLGLMSGFYQQLRDPEITIKAEALRQAQLAMLRGELSFQDGIVNGIPLPPELARYTNTDLTHPFYWSAFTLVGSPW